ncbi:MAG: hypothetical protein R2704_13440 [Microthrixaceae bacterium]
MGICSVTKHNELVTSAADIPLKVRQAFHLATTGRPGRCCSTSPRTSSIPTTRRRVRLALAHRRGGADSCPATGPPRPGIRKIREAAEMIMAAERPVLYVGGGILKACAAEVLRSWPSC